MKTDKEKNQNSWLAKKFPSFKLNDDSGNERTLKEFEGKYLVLYFYPKDLTPGCTTEALSFNENLNKLKKKNVEVLGISPDTIEKHRKFKEKHQLKFSLLVDTERVLIEKLGLWVEKSMYGKKYMGVKRDTFLVGPDSKIIKHYENVKPSTHLDYLLSDLDEIT